MKWKKKSPYIHTLPSLSIFFAQTPWFIAYVFTFFDGFDVNMRWRLLLGLGAIPSGIVVVCSVIEARLQEIEQERINQFARDEFVSYSGSDGTFREEDTDQVLYVCMYEQ